MIFRFWCGSPFGSHFAGVLGAQMEAKAFKKALQKNIKEIMPKMTPNWPQRGSPNGAKIVKNEVLEAPFQGWLPSGLQTPSRINFGEVLGPFRDHFRKYVYHMFVDFCKYSLAACCKQKRSKSQGNAKRMQQGASRNSFSLRAILH